jgi:hypothetical protein
MGGGMVWMAGQEGVMVRGQADVAEIDDQASGESLGKAHAA